LSILTNIDERLIFKFRGNKMYLLIFLVSTGVFIFVLVPIITELPFPDKQMIGCGAIVGIPALTIAIWSLFKIPVVPYGLILFVFVIIGFLSQIMLFNEGWNVLKKSSGLEDKWTSGWEFSSISWSYIFYLGLWALSVYLVDLSYDAIWPNGSDPLRGIAIINILTGVIPLILSGNVILKFIAGFFDKSISKMDGKGENFYGKALGTSEGRQHLKGSSLVFIVVGTMSFWSIIILFMNN
jgi:hypothetical protein